MKKFKPRVKIEKSGQSSLSGINCIDLEHIITMASLYLYDASTDREMRHDKETNYILEEVSKAIKKAIDDFHPKKKLDKELTLKERLLRKKEERDFTRAVIETYKDTRKEHDTYLLSRAIENFIKVSEKLKRAEKRLNKALNPIFSSLIEKKDAEGIESLAQELPRGYMGARKLYEVLIRWENTGQKICIKCKKSFSPEESGDTCSDCLKF